MHVFEVDKTNLPALKNAFFIEDEAVGTEINLNL